MDLWIRSQDKKRLIPKPNLYVIWSKDTQIAYIGDITIGHIAKYKTEKRALEVLDEIQNRIVNLQLVSLEQKGKAREDVLKKKYLRCVYEMPKE